jgi:seryl-tRNA synthetase
MISIEQIRNDVEYLKRQLSFKGDTKSVDTIVSLDKSYRSYISQSNELRAKRNQVSGEISVAKKSRNSGLKLDFVLHVIHWIVKYMIDMIYLKKQ